MEDIEEYLYFDEYDPIEELTCPACSVAGCECYLEDLE